MTIDDAPRMVAGRYRLDASLGAGATGTVWSGLDTVLDRPVAIKAVRMPDTLPASERHALQARVLREARASARIDHPSSVRTFDVVDDGDVVHLVMELVRSPTLSEVVSRDGPLSPVRTAALGLGILDALSAAHRQGIVHRDVKPGNVMVLPDGMAKLGDFGIASVRDDTRITSTGMILGTPSYMAPEQAQADPVGPPADLWGLGALLYFAVEGVAPFDRGEALPTLHAVLHDPPRPMERAGGLAPIITAMLAKSPDDRPVASTVRAALDAVSRPAQKVAPDPGAAAPSASAATATVTRPGRGQPTTPSPPSPAGPPPSGMARRGPRWVWPVIAGALAVTIVAALALTDRAPDEASPAGPTPPETATPADGSSRPDGVPGDWVAYADEATGYQLWHPPSWEPRAGPGNAIDFTDPASGDYLRVDWIQPPGDDPVQAWEDQSQRFAASRPGYQKISIEQTTYQGLPAALWEYVYQGQHATNLGLVTDEYGFALNFQTSEDRWGGSQDVRQAFEAGFRPPN